MQSETSQSPSSAQVDQLLSDAVIPPGASSMLGRLVFRRVRAELKTAELVHAFPSGITGHDRLHDITIKDLLMLDVLPNFLLVPLMQGGAEFPVNFNVAQEASLECHTFKMIPDQRLGRLRIASCALPCQKKQNDHGSQNSSVKWPPTSPTQLPATWC